LTIPSIVSRPKVETFWKEFRQTARAAGSYGDSVGGIAVAYRDEGRTSQWTIKSNWKAFPSAEAADVVSPRIMNPKAGLFPKVREESTSELVTGRGLEYFGQPAGIHRMIVAPSGLRADDIWLINNRASAGVKAGKEPDVDANPTARE
jgi:hypothetical protein